MLIQQFTRWWETLETGQKVGFVCLSFFVTVYLALFIIAASVMLLVTFILMCIAAFIGSIYFLFIDPPWDN